MNWTVFIDLATEIAKNAPALIGDVEKLWADAQAAVAKSGAPAPNAAHQTAMTAAIKTGKARAGDPQQAPQKSQAAGHQQAPKAPHEHPDTGGADTSSDKPRTT